MCLYFNKYLIPAEAGRSLVLSDLAELLIVKNLVAQQICLLTELGEFDDLAFFYKNSS